LFHIFHIVIIESICKCLDNCW